MSNRNRKKNCYVRYNNEEQHHDEDDEDDVDYEDNEDNEYNYDTSNYRPNIQHEPERSGKENHQSRASSNQMLDDYYDSDEDVDDDRSNTNRIRNTSGRFRLGNDYLNDDRTMINQKRNPFEDFGNINSDIEFDGFDGIDVMENGNDFYPSPQDDYSIADFEGTGLSRSDSFDDNDLSPETQAAISDSLDQNKKKRSHEFFDDSTTTIKQETTRITPNPDYLFAYDPKRGRNVMSASGTCNFPLEISSGDDNPKKNLKMRRQDDCSPSASSTSTTTLSVGYNRGIIHNVNPRVINGARGDESITGYYFEHGKQASVSRNQKHHFRSSNNDDYEDDDKINPIMNDIKMEDQIRLQDHLPTVKSNWKVTVMRSDESLPSVSKLNQLEPPFNIFPSTTYWGVQCDRDTEKVTVNFHHEARDWAIHAPAIAAFFQYIWKIQWDSGNKFVTTVHTYLNRSDIEPGSAIIPNTNNQIVIIWGSGSSIGKALRHEQFVYGPPQSNIAALCEACFSNITPKPIVGYVLLHHGIKVSTAPVYAIGCAHYRTDQGPLNLAMHQSHKIYNEFQQTQGKYE
mmetsp:Transcript_32177/g.36901  ORF Transcript_32177/g.36901 Transcript_32177/m.36901 type:complete len:569 (-) Transcript_32177:28-1734(-)